MTKSQTITFWRKPFEYISVVGLLVLAIIQFAFTKTSDGGLRLFVVISPFILALCLYRFYRYARHVNMQARLVQHPVAVEDYSNVKSMAKSLKATDKMFIGYGFPWQQSHTQSLRELLSVDANKWQPPEIVKMIRSTLGLVNDRNMSGKAYFHGLGIENEKPIFVDPEIFGAHTFIGGTTGAGKSTLYCLLIRQMIENGESVIVLDPKGDPYIRNTIYGTLKSMGKEHKFHYFSASNYTSSIRLNLLKNFTAPNQIAERIASILPSGSDDIFKQFVHRHLSILTDSILYCGDSVSLKSFLHYCSGGLESLVIKVIEQYFRVNKSTFPHWINEVKILENKMKKALQTTDTKVARAHALMEYYNKQTDEATSDSRVATLINVALKDKAHYDKLIGSLMPILQKLATNKIGELLSPDYDDPEDSRPIVDLEQVIHKGDALYMNLESLADASTSAALGSLLFSDLTAVAAKMYLTGTKCKTNIFADEVAEQINEPFVQQLNKSRGAGFSVFAATQTISDITVKMGSQAHSDMVIGNTNNKLYLRLKDKSTQESASHEIGETSIKSRDINKSTTGYAPGDGMDYGGGYGNRESSSFEEQVPPSQFSKIPDLEYFAALSDGQCLKVRMPYFILPDDWDFKPEMHQYDVPFRI